MEGRAAARPDWGKKVSRRSVKALQWRAGQLPGLTHHPRRLLRRRAPSMEGRAAARPDRGRLGPRCGEPPPSMEGRAAARPDVAHRAHRVPGRAPSMEGRAAARPDDALRQQRPDQDGLPSMEGRAAARPDPSFPLDGTLETLVLQWRAGQLPGLTSASSWKGPPRPTAFNGGPGSCPA